MPKTTKQLDQEVADILAQPASGDKQPLYGHTSEASAYLVADYPYGFVQRTQIRYWLEEKSKKGWRLVSQTKNPKTGAWNKPKASTYADWGAAMYLDGDGHVQWEGVGPYTNDQKILAFVRTFPGAKSELTKVAPAKLRHLRGLISGQIVWTINGVPQVPSEGTLQRYNDELATWEEVQRHLSST